MARSSIGSKPYIYRIWWRLFQRGVIYFDEVPSDSYLDCVNLTDYFQLLVSESFLETASMAVECRVERWLPTRSWDAADIHPTKQTKVRDVRATSMYGGGFAADGDLTLGRIPGAQVELLDSLGCGASGI